MYIKHKQLKREINTGWLYNTVSIKTSKKRNQYLTSLLSLTPPPLSLSRHPLIFSISPTRSHRRPLSLS